MRTQQSESHKDTINLPTVRSMQHVSNLPRLGLIRRLAVESYANSNAKRVYPKGVIVHFQLTLARHCRVPCELEIRILRGHRISRSIRIWTRSSSRAAKPRHPPWAKKATGIGPNDIQNLSRVLDRKCPLGSNSLPLVSSQQLNYKFYDSSCPNLTKIVQQGVWSAIANDSRIAASLLRLHFHDCFVNGCDASVLLDDTSTLQGEKNAIPNKDSARGFEVIDKIKSNLEEACPSTVSCTDILTLAATSAVYFSGGPYWPVALGRRDGTTASKDAANNDLPSPFEPLENITAKFTAKGLDMKDVVVLSGAHTIGFAQCFTFKPRLFNFDDSGQPDPTLDTSLLTNLQSVCPNQADSDTKLAPLDPVTSTKFDNVYFKRLVNNSGLLQSDQVLMGDNRTASMVISYSRFPYLFNKDFGASMVKMANIGVLTGQSGQIRKNCRVVN
ncbi:hypothetical protein ACLB2K_005945 [Fragaria x ananassa]